MDFFKRLWASVKRSPYKYGTVFAMGLVLGAVIF